MNDPTITVVLDSTHSALHLRVQPIHGSCTEKRQESEDVNDS